MNTHERNDPTIYVKQEDTSNDIELHFDEEVLVPYYI